MVGAGQRQAVGRLERQFIGEVDALEERLDLVEAVGPLAEDAEVEVEFCGRPQVNHHLDYSKPSLRRRGIASV